MTLDKFSITLFLMIAYVQLHAQCTSLHVPLENRIQESSMIVEGKVIKKTSFWGEQQRIIYTSNLIEVYKVFKGNIETNQIEVTTTGGILENDAMEVNPSLRLSIGQTGLFMLKNYTGNNIDNAKSLIWRPVADDHSLVHYNRFNDGAKDGHTQFESLDDLYDLVEAYTNEKHQVKGSLIQIERAKSPMMPVIDNSGISPTTVNGGKSEVITITGTNFESDAGAVYFDSPDDGSGGSYSGTSSWHIVSWTDTEIQVRVPTKSGSGGIFIITNSGLQSSLSNQSLHINYCISNITDSGGNVWEPDLIDESGTVDDNGGYTFNYSTSTANNGVDITSVPAAIAALERAVDTWHTQISLPFYLGTDCGTVTTQLPGASTGNDGTNLITFDSDIWDLDVQASSSTLAVMYSRYSKCGDSNWEVVDLDMVIRRNGGGVTWEYGPALPSTGESDFESVVLHEFGHAVQLQHVINSGAVMHYSITNGTSNRTLGTSDDIAGGSYIMTQSLAYSPPVYVCCCGGDFPEFRALVAYNSNVECDALILPVELLSFEGEKQENGVHLNWETALEIDNDFYTLERSIDGKEFQQLAKVQGAGNDINANRYDYFDSNPAQGVNYYRLWQTDFDGTRESLGVVAIEYDYSTKAELYPNPLNGNLINLVYDANTNGELSLSIKNIAGQLVWNGERSVSEGYQRLELDLPELTDGIYLLSILHNNKTQNLRFIKN